MPWLRAIRGTCRSQGFVALQRSSNALLGHYPYFVIHVYGFPDKAKAMTMERTLAGEACAKL